MDALLVGGGLAAGGYLLNSSKKTNPAKIPSAPSVYDSCGLDSRVYERQIMNTHLGNPNSVESSRYVERPESVRTGTYRDNVASEQTMSLTGELKSNNDFNHNNMQPFFGSTVKQNVDVESSSGLVERFTGISSDYKAKEEISPMFGNQQSNIYGTQTAPESIKDRFVSSKFHQGVPINEPVRVGPGLNKGYTATPDGGFQQGDTLDYVRDPTVDEMRVKTNPKVSYEARVIRGFKGTRRGMAPVVSQNRVIRFHAWDEGARMMATPVVSAPANRENYHDKCTNRQNTLHTYTAPAGPVGIKNQQSHTATDNLTTSRQDLEAYGFRNAYNSKNETKLKIQYCSDVKKIGATDSKYLGQAATVVQKMMAPLQDIMRPTIKETNIHDSAPNRNVGVANKKGAVYDTNDVAKPTIKETNIHDTREGFMGTTTNQKHYYNPDDTTRPTIKETNIHDNRLGLIRNVQSAAHPDVPEPLKTTARETLKEYIAAGNLRGPNRTMAKTDTPIRTTMKETICEDNHTGGAMYSKGRAYTTNPVVAPDTFKQHTADNEYSGQAHGRQYGGYSVADTVAPDTVRQETSNVEYQGIANGLDKPTSYADIYNATLNDIKEDISKGRAPTQSGCKTGGNVAHIGDVEISEGLENRGTLSGATPLNNCVVDSSTVHMRNDKCQFNTSDRLDASNLDAFKSNPLTQSLHSTA